jgi:hypothetical protein
MINYVLIHIHACALFSVKSLTQRKLEEHIPLKLQNSKWKILADNNNDRNFFSILDELLLSDAAAERRGTEPGGLGAHDHGAGR